MTPDQTKLLDWFKTLPDGSAVEGRNFKLAIMTGKGVLLCSEGVWSHTTLKLLIEDAAAWPWKPVGLANHDTLGLQACPLGMGIPTVENKTARMMLRKTLATMKKRDQQHIKKTTKRLKPKRTTEVQP